MNFIENLSEPFYDKFMSVLSLYWPKVLWALSIVLIWLIISVLAYKLVKHTFAKFKIINLLDKLTKELTGMAIENDNNKKNKNDIWIFSNKIPIDKIVWKALAYYIFLVFFRYSIVVIWITEVEQFLWDLINYLPKLFLWVMIGFFGIRFASFIYDIVFNALDLAKQKSAKIIASWAKIIILFFTFMVALNYIWIVDSIINIILIWFVSMLTIAWGLAFWLWWKEIAREILEEFKK